MSMLQVDLDWKTGVAAKDWGNIAKKEKLDVSLLLFWLNDCPFAIKPIHQAVYAPHGSMWSSVFSRCWRCPKHHYCGWKFLHALVAACLLAPTAALPVDCGDADAAALSWCRAWPWSCASSMTT